MEVLQILSLWNQKVDSQFTNHKPLILTLLCYDYFLLQMHTVDNDQKLIICSLSIINKNFM